MIRSFVFFLMGLAILGCAKNVPSNSSGITESKDMCLYGTTVKRFSSNQPSIKVTNVPKEKADYCLFWRQGYEEASDRFLQMDLSRRLAHGTLSEVFGEATVDKDTLVRAIGLPLATARSVEKIQRHFPEEYAVLEAFADGVNNFLGKLHTIRPEWIATYRRYSRNSNYVPTRWTPADSIAVGTSVSFALSNQLMDKVFNGLFTLSYPGDVTEYISNYDYRPITDRLIAMDRRGELGLAAPTLNSALPRVAPRKARENKDGWKIPEGLKNVWPELWKAFSQHCAEPLSPTGGCSRVAPLGSNNWAVSPSAAGSPYVLLANDTHLPIQSPSGMYEVGLNSVSAGGTFEAAGVNLPGVPGVLIGHNRRIGWQLTNFGADVDDGYFEYLDNSRQNVAIASRKEKRPDPKQPGREIEVDVKTYAPIKVIKTPLYVRLPDGSLDERTFEVRTIRDGQRVLLKDAGKMFKLASESLSTIFEEQMDIGYRWTGHEGSTVFVAALRVNRAQNFREFQEALQHFDVGAQNFVYGDVDGNIGYIAHGKYPIRPFLSASTPPGSMLTGLGEMEWAGFREEVPQLYNPEEGIIVSANNDAWGHSLNPNLSDFKDYMGYSFSTGIRAERIAQLLEAKRGQGMTAKDMQAIQYDHHDLLAEKYIALLRANKDKLDLKNDAVKNAVEKMLSWDLQAVRNRTEPTVFYEWLEALIDHYYEPIIAPTRATLKTMMTEQEWKTIEDSKRSSLMLKTSYHKLADALKAAESDEGLKALQSTLETAATRLDEKGRVGVRWGDLQRLVFKNFLEKIIPSFVTLPLERDGAVETVDVSLTDRNVAPNFRMTLVMKPGRIEGYNVIPGGNFGPVDRNGLYDELMMWRDGRVRELVPILD